MRGYPRASLLRTISDRLVGFGEYAYGDPEAWARRIGPDADAARVRAVRCGRSARWLLIAYVATLVVVFGVQGFPTTGEAMLPNVLLFGSMLVVIGGLVALLLAEQSNRRGVARIVNAAFGATERHRWVVPGDALTQIDDYDHWTAVHRRRWFDGTLLPIPAPRGTTTGRARGGVR